jgi:polysaccharide export outer membrane protein
MRNKKIILADFVGAAALLCAFVSFGQSAALAADDTPANAKPTGTTVAADYAIGAGDVLTVTIGDAPEFGGRFRVADSGVISIPGVSTPVKAEGQNPIELANSIREALIDAKQLRDPHVTVFVDEFHGRTVSVLGAVGKPAVYPLQKKTSVLEALSLAGGALPNSGNTVTIVRGPASAEATNTSVGSVQTFKMSDLTSGKDLSVNIEVKSGDVVSVSAAQVVYVVGAVVKPGGYTIQDSSSGVSVVQAIALAEGFKYVASRRGLIVRQSTDDHARVEIPVDIGQMMAGKQTDAILAPNDILYIPVSGSRSTAKVMGDVAMAAVNGIAIYGVGYGIGYRVGNVK